MTRSERLPLTGATSHDVARVAGVNQSTVSRALSGQPGVSPATRLRIESAAKELGYVPNLVGRQLSTKRTNVIAFMINDLANSAFQALIDGMHRRFKKAGYRVVLYTGDDDAGADFAELLGGAIAGVVLATAAMDSPVPLNLLERGIPCVLVNRQVPGVPVDVSIIDNRQGGRAAADLVVDLGHRRIGGLFGFATASTSIEREEGAREGLRAHGHQFADGLLLHGPFTVDAGRVALRAMFNGIVAPPTAVICQNDTMAIGVLDEALRMGIEVPRDLTVVGFDDTALAAMAAFDLTTVHCDLEKMAVDAAELLLRRIAKPDAPVQRIIQSTGMTLRGTHGPPRRR